MTRLALQLRDAAEEHPRLTAALLVALSSVVLVARLSTPDRIIFDETYYVEDALGYLETGVEPSFAVHPTLGKWLIAAGIAVLGDSPLGWRISGALAGVLAVLLTHLLARRLLAGTRWGPLLAVTAPLLLLTDGLFLVQSRISMLDAFLVTAVVGAMLLLVVDRDRRVAGQVRPGRPSVRWLAGIAFGLALAIKWNGALALGAAGLLTIAWELGDAWRSGGAGGAFVRSALRRATAVVGSLVVLPLIVYGVSWLPWLAAYEHTWAADCDDVEPVSACDDAQAPVAERLDGLWRYHDAMLGFHLGLESTHSYRGDPLGWVVLQRPVVYYWETCSEDRANGVLVEDEETGEMVPPEPCQVPVGTAGEILAVGNPVLWWSYLAVVPLLVGGAVRRDRRSAVPLVTWLALWLPWLFVSRAAFLFYMAPAVPLMAVGVVVGLDRLDRRSRLLGGYVGAVVGAGLGLVGAWGAQLVGPTPDGWRARLLGLAVGAGIGTLGGAVRDAVADWRAKPSVGAPDDVGGERFGDAGEWLDDPGRGPGSAVTVVPPGEPATEPDSWSSGATVVLVTESTDSDTGRAADRGGANEQADTDRPGPARTTAPETSRTATPTPAAPLWLVPLLVLLLVGTAVGLWVFFGPVWYGVPLDREVLRWRWWFPTWI